MVSKNQPVNQVYKGCRIFVSTSQPNGEKLFRAAYSVLGDDGSLLILGSVLHQKEELAFARACDTAQNFVDEVRLRHC